MKKYLSVIPLVFLLCFFVGCQDKAAMAELVQFKAQAAVEEQNTELVKRLIDEFNKGNVEIWRGLCTPEFAYYQPSETSEPMSLEQTIDTFKMIYLAFSDYSWNISELISKGDKVIARTNFTGTHEGEWGGIPATGNKIRISIISIFKFTDGKWLETREEEDSMSLMRQLGMELRPKEEVN